MLTSLILRRRRRLTAERLYGGIVAQARQTVFYTELAVPDTLEGRFDLLVLHVHLLFRRLTNGNAAERAVGQAVFDRFCADMDASLREIGIGDLAVPRRMRDMGEAFYGRAAAYDTALAEADDAPLAISLLRNVYGGEGTAAPSARRLSHYVRATVASLAAQDASAIARGELHFPRPEEN